jgi:hypothetical protein
MYKIEDRYCGIRLIQLDQVKNKNTNNIMNGIKECLSSMFLCLQKEDINNDDFDLEFSYKENNQKITINVTYQIDGVGHHMITVKAIYGKVPENKRSEMLKLLIFLNSFFIQTKVSMIPNTNDVELSFVMFFYKYFHTAELCIGMEYLQGYGRMYLDASNDLISENQTAKFAIDRLKNGL